ncbi:P-loop containing nucleoside triphosphate hydrolase protein [Polyplosphaeria fusca]|uniref:P-loop containing nucleoside triphosphate hydrolase protein n=1 Tax=Polyplosphaeria fusca TaxID=682080 RepID=A0A9P4V0P8_9PLEO|nr:P-loop containing nucleoside triphosphate hydrolase protein [Polyplosphaeria fusca]
MTGNSFTIHAHEDQTGREYFHHSSGQRINTDVVLIEALRKQYPQLDLVVCPAYGVPLLGYASSGNASVTPIEDKTDAVYSSVKWRYFMPPARRLDGNAGAFAERIIFGKYLYKWKDQEVILYIANGRDGGASYPEVVNQYILTTSPHKIDELIRDASLWGARLHNEVWVFDQGFWQKSAELYNAVQKSSWDDVILDSQMKKAIIADVENFFDSRSTYDKFKVPWKRGIIYYGPPGNGKTISIKAMMHSLYQRGQDTDDSRMQVPTLYVKTLASWAGPEYSLAEIFGKARQEAPCYLVFEDLDSIVSDSVRSYFLNEVDGLKSNDGILMVGSTNHLERLDPGIAKRPSRFDRKYFFPNPSFDERVKYAEFWQRKLRDNEDVEFPDRLCKAVARITDKFSFAYMQEAFVASLLAIAIRNGDDNALGSRWAGPHDLLAYEDQLARIHTSTAAWLRGGGEDDDDKDLDKLVLWRELKKQVKILREEMESDGAKARTMGLGSANPFGVPQPPPPGMQMQIPGMGMSAPREELERGMETLWQRGAGAGARDGIRARGGLGERGNGFGDVFDMLQEVNDMHSKR